MGSKNENWEGLNSWKADGGQGGVNRKVITKRHV